MEKVKMRRRSLNLDIKYKYARNIAFGGVAVFLIGGGVFLQPFSFTENTNATTERTTNGDYYLETTATDLNLTIHATPAGTQETASHDVTVKTDDPAGYTLTVSVNNDTSNALNLNGNTSATEKFVATSGTYASPKALDENSWGFADTLAKKNADQWAAVPLLSNAQQLKQTNAANTSGDTTTIHYAINAKYDGKHSNGNYSNTIVYSVTGNTIPKSYLQDMTPSTCAALDLYDSSNAAATTYTYTDKRDNQDYRIRRLKMGTGSNTACWMVDNLKLTKTTIEAAGNSAKLDTNTSNVASGSTFSLTASNSSTWCTNDNATCDDKSMLIDTSYGTLYNWFAATAGTGKYSTSSGTAAASICPGKGTTSSSTWHLPTGNTNNEWYQLFQAYQSDYGWSTISGTSDTDTMTNTWSTTIGPNFIYSGYRSGANTGGQSSTGYGFWWSSTARNNSSAYRAYLDYNGRNVGGGTSSNLKYYGYAVRCVLTGVGD